MADGVLGIAKVLRQKTFSLTNADGIESSCFLRGGFLLSASFYAGRESAPATWMVRLSLPIHSRS